MASYNFSESGDFTTTPVILSELQANIVASSISSATVLYISQTGDTITIFFNGALSGPDQITLAGLCTAYTNEQRPVAADSTNADFTVTGGMGVGFNIWVGSPFEATNTSTAGSILNIPSFTYTSTSLSPSNVNIASINQVTIAETNASTTIANAASFYIAGAPTVGTNVTAITNPYALQIASGKSYFGGTIQIPTGATNGYILTSDSNGNASWQANSFSGGFGDGTAALPGVFFSAQPGTGFYRPASGQIGVELAGANYATFTTSGLNLVTGSTLNVGSSGTTSPLNVFGLITGSNGLTISSGASTFQTTTLATSSTAAAVIMSGGLAVARNMWIGTSFTGSVLTSNSVNGILLNAPAITMTDNVLAAGTTTNINIHTLNRVTLATATNAITATTAATLYIANAPLAGTNFTITTPYALQVAAGASIFQATTSSGLLTASAGFTLTTGALNLTSTSGAISLSGTSFTTNSAMSITATTLSTSSATGGLILSGGIGIAKNIWAGTSYSDAILVSNSTRGLVFNSPAVTLTDNALAAGTTSNINSVALGRVTLATSANAITATNAATLYIDNAPLAGTNVTITNPYALQIAAGKTLIGGALQITTGASANQVLRSDSAGNSSWSDPVIYYSAFSTAALTTTSTSLIAMSGITVTLVSIGTYQITLSGTFYNQALNIRSLFDIYNSTAAATVANSTFTIGGTFYQNANNYGTGTLNIVVIATISTPNTVIQGRFATSNASGSVTMVSNGVPAAGCNCTTSLVAVRLGA